MSLSLTALRVCLRLLLSLAASALALLSSPLLSLSLLSLPLLTLTLLPLARLTLLSLLSASLLPLLLAVLPSLIRLRRPLAALSACALLTLLPLATVLTLLAGLRLLAALIAAIGEPALRVICALLLTLAHAFVHRFQAADEIARAIGGLRLLTLSVARLRGRLRLLQTLAQIRDVRTDLLLGGVHPIRGSGARLLLRVPKLFLDLAATQRVSRTLQRT